jgi:hypothetical protein
MDLGDIYEDFVKDFRDIQPIPAGILFMISFYWLLLAKCIFVENATEREKCLELAGLYCLVAVSYTLINVKKGTVKLGLCIAILFFPDPICSVYFLVFIIFEPS